ncbi:MAG: hypothetical protein GY751_03965, partial [Bacteroidetes bacterium]|nr:hypothetical protein [Bacteroidota bacterium]
MSEKENIKLAIATEADLIMRKDAIEAFPNECCGFMYGYDTERERVIEKAIPVINSKEGDQRRRFEINPFDYMKAESYALKH